jgi:hypothetical protein
MKEKSPIQKVREYLNSEPSDKEKQITLAICMVIMFAAPTIVCISELLSKSK